MVFLNKNDNRPPIIIPVRAGSRDWYRISPIIFPYRVLFSIPMALKTPNSLIRSLIDI